MQCPKKVLLIFFFSFLRMQMARDFFFSLGFLTFDYYTDFQNSFWTLLYPAFWQAEEDFSFSFKNDDLNDCHRNERQESRGDRQTQVLGLQESRRDRQTQVLWYSMSGKSWVIPCMEPKALENHFIFDLQQQELCIESTVTVTSTPCWQSIFPA